MLRLIFVFLAVMLLSASCAKPGVAVPDSFPVKITLPAGSELINDSATQMAASSAPGVEIVYFKCSGSASSVQSHIASQLKGKGYEKWSMPGVADMGGSEMYQKKGSSTMITFSPSPGDAGEFMLMSMAIPDLPNFQP